MKDLLTQIHTIVDTLRTATSAQIEQLIDKENEQILQIDKFNKIDKIITDLEINISGYNSPFYILESIYFSSPNFPKIFIENLEISATSMMLNWVKTERVINDINEKFNGIPLPDDYAKFTSFGQKVNSIFATLINGVNWFCNMYLETSVINSLSFHEHMIIADKFEQISKQFKIIIKGEEQEKLDIRKVNDFIESLSTIEMLRDGVELNNNDKTIKELLMEDPNNIDKVGYNINFISGNTFSFSDKDKNYSLIIEISTFLHRNNLCQDNIDNISTALTSNSDKACDNKVLWVGSKSDAIRVANYLNISLFNFNNCFTFKDDKKLERKHESKNGASLLSEYLMNLQKSIPKHLIFS